MSIVERALRRSRDARASQAKDGAALTGPVAPDQQSHSAGQSQESNLFEDQGGERLSLSSDALDATGLISPTDVARLQAGQYRNVRRVLAEQIAKDPAEGHRGVFVAVTSAMAGDGKTYTAFNLAMSFAREPDQETVLIDADLPKRQLTKHLGLQDAIGLADCLVEDRDLETGMIHTDIPRLHIIPAGQSHVDGSELLGGGKFLALFERVRMRYPNLNIVLDAGPLLLSAEAEMLCRNVPQALLVVRHGVSTRKSVQDAISRMGERPRTSLLLNAWEPSLFEEQTNYGDYYGSMV